jgi:hypothetical protein
MEASRYIVVLYNGIEKWLESEENIAQVLNQVHIKAVEKAFIISFEQSYAAAKEAIALYEHHPHLEIKIIKKRIFIDYISLLWCARKLKKIVSSLSSYTLHAQDPLAGFICIKAHTPKACTQITINAPLILASEYEYEHQHETNILKKWWHTFCFKQLQMIETAVYSFTHKSSIVSIQTISPALKEFLFNTYGAQPKHITVQSDMAHVINNKDKEFFKTTLRTELNLSQTAHLYCFKGNYSSRENPHEIISFFKQRLQENAQSFLLVLTPDKDMFEIALRQQHVPFESYQVKTIDQANAYRYLAACDAGIIFRDMHIVHWTSKPLNALEYKAAGLEIIHNNTIAYITKQLEHNSEPSFDVSQINQQSQQPTNE